MKFNTIKSHQFMFLISKKDKNDNKNRSNKYNLCISYVVAFAECGR